MAFQVGQVINGRYRIKSVIEQIGTASTYVARKGFLEEISYLGIDDPDTVIVKAFQPISEEIQSQFLTEFATLVQIGHPNILRTLDYGAEANTVYLVTAFVSGSTLRNLYRRGTIVPFNVVVSYTKQLASALDYIHGTRVVVHRAVKPENIFWGELNANILLSNFGIAAYANNDLTGRRGVIGTAAYMAPEQIQGKVEPASDQYSLGVTVYEWLSGQLPFAGSSETEILISHMTKPVPPLNLIVPTLSLEVGNVVQKALAKNPRDRYDSVSEFARRLEQAFQQRALPQPTLNTPYSGNPSPTFHSIYPYPDSSQTNTQAPAPPPYQAASGAMRGGEPTKVVGGTTRGDEPTEQQGTQLSLFAIARTKLDNDDRAIVGNIYTIEAGISQQRPDDFYGQRFRVRVQDPTAPFLLIFSCMSAKMLFC